jgi:RNA polymerase sigma factor (sigma-70 family)
VEGSPELIAFCEEAHPKLVRMLGLYCGSREIAEELTQETLARVWRHWRKVRSLDQPLAWAQRVALNLAKSHFRSAAAERRAKKRLEGRPAEPHSDPDAVDKQAVRAAIARLPDRQKTVLVLHYYLDLSFAEVADWMNVPEGTAKSLAHRAVARLREEEGMLDLEEALNVT